MARAYAEIGSREVKEKTTTATGGEDGGDKDEGEQDSKIHYSS